MSMRRLAAVAANFTFLLAWAAWFGGLLTLGAVSAPGIFKTARQWPAAEGALVYRFAGSAAGEGFRRFNSLALACGALLLLAGAAAWLLDRRPRPAVPRLHLARMALAALTLGITAWLTWGLFPEITRLRAASVRQSREGPGSPVAYPQLGPLRETGDAARFDALHHSYEHWSMLQAWLLLGIGGLSALLLAPGGEGESPPATRGRVAGHAKDRPIDGEIARVCEAAALFTPAQLQEARAVQAQTGEDIGDILVRLGRITPVQLLQARAHLHGLKAVDVNLASIDPAAVGLVPAEIARRHHVIPIMRQGDTLFVAVADPTDVRAVQAVRDCSRMRVQMVLGEPRSIEEAIARCYAPGE